MRRTLILVAVIAAACAQTAISQEDPTERIRRSLEGRFAHVKMDLPAIDAGVFMYFDDSAVSLNEAEYQRLLKTYGVAIKSGHRARITGVRFSAKGIEVDLDGGGSPDRDWIVGSVRLEEPAPLAKSQREIDLENQLQHEQNGPQAAHLRSELEHERRRRLDQDDRNRQAFARVARLRSEYIEENRKNWGSRLIVSVRSRKGTVTMRDMLNSLSKYVELMPREAAKP